MTSAEKTIRQSEFLLRQKYSVDGAEHLNAYLSLSFKKHMEIIRNVLQVPAGGLILDVGCGTGQFLIELVQNGFKATGIDTFEEMDGIDEAITRARFDEHGLTPILVKGNASQMPFPDASFDLVTNFGMFEHIPPNLRREVLCEMFRIVKPGGYLFVIAGPNKYFPYDQHVPKIFFANWLPRGLKIRLAEMTGTRLLLNAPWGITRKELKDALPARKAEMFNLYSRFLGMESDGTERGFSLHPIRLAVYLKRAWRLHLFFGITGRLLEIIRFEHCYIVAFKKILS